MEEQIKSHKNGRTTRIHQSYSIKKVVIVKYYINCGAEKTVLNASTPQQAAVLGFRKIIKESEEEEFEIPLEIRVSQKGPEEHDDDYLIDTFTVIGLLYLMREDEDEEDGE